MKKIVSRLRRTIGGQALFDTAAWVVSVLFAALLRYEFNISALHVEGLLGIAVFGALVSYMLGLFAGLYRGRHATGSVAELLALSIVSGATAAPVSLAVFIWGTQWGVPRSIILIAMPIFFMSSAAVRVLRRRLGTRQPALGGRSRALVYGAGQAAEFLVSQLLSDTKAPYLPVGLLEDFPGRQNRWIQGVKTLGGVADFRDAVRSTASNTLIVAEPTIDRAHILSLASDAQELGVEVVILPAISDVLRGSQNMGSLPKLTIDDLTGRSPASFRSAEALDYLRGRTVLVTGAGGSIGSELCRQVALWQPKTVVFLDRDETGLLATQLEVEKSGLLNSANTVLADIRDLAAIDEAFAEWHPDVVFHAAALKHLPILERYPNEAWQTNVIGTLNVLNAAMKYGVDTLVNISTDKAADPISVLGKSKKIAEHMTAWAGRESSRNFMSVRFGNVLGSRGSLVPNVTRQIENGLTVTVTDENATRYFMTVEEACQLVLHAGSFRESDSALVLDMGEPVRVLDVVNRLIENSGRKVDIEFSGLRPGEKLHETLHSDSSRLEKTGHPLIFRDRVRPIGPDMLETFAADFAPEN